MTFKLKKDEKYLFATDLDGTFLSRNDGSFHILNYEAVNKIKEAGHKFVIATGRSWWWTQKIYSQLNVVDAVIHFSGAQVYHPLDPNFKEYTNFIPVDIAIKILRKLNVLDYARIVRILGIEKQAEITSKEDIDLINFDVFEFCFILPNQTSEQETKNVSFFKEIQEKIPEYIFRLWKYSTEDHITISPKGTNKAVSLEYVAKHYGIDQKNVIYFGDNINDLDALKWTGYGYAPKNAIEKAKEVADEVLEKENWEGAVAKKIIELIDR